MRISGVFPVPFPLSDQQFPLGKRCNFPLRTDEPIDASQDVVLPRPQSPCFSALFLLIFLLSPFLPFWSLCDSSAPLSLIPISTQKRAGCYREREADDDSVEEMLEGMRVGGGGGGCSKVEPVWPRHLRLMLLLLLLSSEAVGWLVKLVVARSRSSRRGGSASRNRFFAISCRGCFLTSCRFSIMRIT